MGVTSYEQRYGEIYHKAILPFGELCMIRVPIDPPGLRKKLDSQWMKVAWVGRSESSDANIGLSPHGIIEGSTIRRLPAESQNYEEFYSKLTAKVSDPVLSQAKLLKGAAAVHFIVHGRGD